MPLPLRLQRFIAEDHEPSIRSIVLEGGGLECISASWDRPLCVPGSRLYYGSTKSAPGFSTFVFVASSPNDASAFARQKANLRALERDVVHGSARQTVLRNLVIFTPTRAPDTLRKQVIHAEHSLELIADRRHSPG
jgi:hypothetical protein